MAVIYSWMIQLSGRVKASSNTLSVHLSKSPRHAELAGHGDDLCLLRIGGFSKAQNGIAETNNRGCREEIDSHRTDWIPSVEILKANASEKCSGTNRLLETKLSVKRLDIALDRKKVSRHRQGSNIIFQKKGMAIMAIHQEKIAIGFRVHF